MSYPKLPKLFDLDEIVEFNNNLISRKEFNQYAGEGDRNYKDPNEYDAFREKYLHIRGHQLFCKNLINPYTPYKRFLLNWKTGVGKTSAALTIANEFIKLFQKLYRQQIIQNGPTKQGYQLADKETPSVFVIGFTKLNIIKELLKYPEFGFISIVERDELSRLQKLANIGGQVDIKNYKDYYGVIRRRITNKAKNGFFKFFGYQEFVNRLFISETVNLTDLENLANKRMMETGGNSQTTTLEQIIAEHIANNVIQINVSMIQQFENSLIICDEIHNTYNSYMKNNYGVAISYVLDSQPSARAVFLSATPISNSPTEVVEILNYLLPPESKVTKQELFGNNYTDISEESLEKIGLLSYGRVSFIQDINPKFYPAVDTAGEERRLRHEVMGVRSIPYLKFIKCDMSPLHLATYKQFIQKAEHDKKVQAEAIEAKNSEEVLNNPNNTNGGLEFSINSYIDGGDDNDDNDDNRITPIDEFINTNSNQIDDFINTENTENTDNNQIEGSAEKKKPNQKPKPKPKSKITNKSKKPVNKGQESKEKNNSESLSADSGDNDGDLGEQGEEDSKLGVPISADSYTIIDMVFPNPQSDTVGLYRSNEIRGELINATNEFKDRIGLNISKVNGVMVIGGNWLLKDRVGKYSSKLAALGKALENSFNRSCERLIEMSKEMSKDNLPPFYTAGEKMLICHERVRGSGILLYAAFMRENNIIDEYSEPVDNTRCAICGGGMAQHDKFIAEKNLPSHMYYPARFVIAHSEVERGAMLVSLDKYNATDNAYGTNYRFLLGSKIIRESYDIKDTAEMHIFSRSTHMAAFNQLRGRVDRHGSHQGLPPHRQHVTMYYYLTTIPDSENSIDTVSPEEYRYTEKLVDYKVIQRIEKVMHEYAIDAAVHRETIMPEELRKKYFANGDKMPPIESVDPFYFEPRLPLPTGKINNITFNSRNHVLDEISSISYIIKRLFLNQPVWTWDNLWEAVKEPPIGVEANPRLFTKENFAIALDMLASDQISYVNNNLDMQNEKTVTERMLIQMMFDINDKYIYKNLIKHRLVQAGKYYILLQVLATYDNTTLSVGHRTSVSAKVAPIETVVRDIDAFMRPVRSIEPLRINIDDWLKISKFEQNYDIVKSHFIETYIENPSADALRPMLSEYAPEFYTHLLKDIISWYVDEYEIDAATEKLFKAVIDLFEQFGAIIYIHEVLKYKEIAKKFTKGKVIKFNTVDEKLKAVTDYARTTPIGFIDTDGVRLYDSPVWISTSKVSLNLRTTWSENPHIVGYFEVIERSSKFKLRRPIQLIKRNIKERTIDKTADSRLIERGMVCATKTKSQLVAIANMLKINISKINGEQGSVRIKGLCDAIMNRLIELEIRERLKDSNIKYLYLWYEQQPTV